MVDRLVQAPDSGDAELARRAVEPALGFVRDDLRSYTARGTRVELPRGSRPHEIVLVDVLDGRATVVACQLDDAVVRGADGTVIDDDVVTKRVSAELLRVGGSWKLADAQIVEQWDGAVGCEP
jgi:hypothetical protein